MKLPLIPLDKANHFIYGFIIFIISQIFFIDLISVGIVLAVALGKEIRDQITYKGFDWLDVVVTISSPLIIYITK